MLTLWNTNGYRPYRTRSRGLDLDALTRSFFGSFPSIQGYRNYPPTTVKEEENGLVLRSEVPGYGPENLDVTFEEGVLTLRGKHVEEVPVAEEGSEEKTETKTNVTFLRSFRVSSDINAEAIEAKLKHGVLTVKLPFAEKEKPKSITVSVG